MSQATFRVECASTVPGEQVAVVGSWNAWDLSHPFPLSTTPATFPIWSAAVPLPPAPVPAKPLEYKYVILRNDRRLRLWEPGRNRTLDHPATPTTPHRFGSTPSPSPAPAPIRPAHPPATSTPLDALELAVTAAAAASPSWRQRLSFVRALFTDPAAARAASFHPAHLPHLATVAVFLSFLSSGQLPCSEDGGHHRPNHHAHEARRLDAALARLPLSPAAHPYTSYLVRSIFPLLPSYSPQFTAAVPLTRIRDIAHRSDIPHDFKQEIKHTLQNKLHRCAGPEDLRTSARLLERINNGHFSHGLKEQFNIFHAELLDFFNASSLDDRLRYLQGNPNTASVADLAAQLLTQKHAKLPALQQMHTLTALRTGIADLPLMQMSPPHISEGEDNQEQHSKEQLPSEDVQKTRLADIDLEGYAFMLLAGVAKDAEQHQKANFDWNNALTGLSLSLENIALSGVCPAEARATARELLPAGEEAKEGKYLRVKASVDRALRFAESFSSAINDVFTRRATSLGQALGVDQHSVAVFAEAQIRSNITFQASRIADACAQTCRKALSLPPWDPLYAGEARGKLVHAEELSHLATDMKEDVIAVCRNCDGDEDIPANVRGVILGRSLPHLSHLGVRARQAGVVFVCAEEREVFEKVWRDDRFGHARMEVNVRQGLKPLTEIQSEEISLPSDKDTKHNGGVELSKTVKITFDGRLKKPIPIAEATKDTSSSKCAFAGKLYGIASRSDNIFAAPNGLALPHGVFQAQCSQHAQEYKSLIKDYADKFANGEDGEAARPLFEFVASHFKLEPEQAKQIQLDFPEGTRVMVRSSANAEDLEDMSGAGLYDSIANVPVHSTEALQLATSQVWASLWTKRAASSRASYGVPHEQVSMAVLIQEMVAADLSFVAFSRDPVTKGNAGVYVEVAVGMGETLASASSAGSPYRFRVDRETLSVDVISLASYGNALVPNASDEGLRAQVIDYSHEPMTINEKFRTSLVQRIAKALLLLEKELGGPQDVEGAVNISKERTTVHIVQARPQIV